MKNIPLITGDDEAIPEIYSNMLDFEVSRFLCLSIYLCDDDALYTRYLTELSGDGRRLIRRAHERLSSVIERDKREH